MKPLNLERTLNVYTQEREVCHIEVESVKFLYSKDVSIYKYEADVFLSVVSLISTT